jgi:uncharacterized protein DUF1841
MTEDDAWQKALDDHPEYRDGVLDGSLPEEILDANGELINPRLHLTMHAIVEQQLAADEPPGIAEIARQLADLGIAQHEIRHLISGPLAEQLWMMQSKGAQFDEAGYLEELRNIVASLR